MAHPIGVLGGMGPEATILFQKKLMDAVKADDDSDHFPLLIDMNPQVPSRIAHLIEGNSIDPGPTLAAMARRLEAAGAVALAMPCNTAHHYAGQIEQAVNIPLLNMVERSADYALSVVGGNGVVGFLASPAVKMTGLFDKACAARGLRSVWPDDQDAMLSAIREIKKNGPTATARDVLRKASERLVEKGAGLQLVACSEFSLIADSVSPAAEVADTVDLLVDAVVAFYAQSGG